MFDSASRKPGILATIDIHAEKGLEMGSLDCPVVTKLDGRILYLDHLDAEGLKKITRVTPMPDWLPQKNG